MRALLRPNKVRSAGEQAAILALLSRVLFFKQLGDDVRVKLCERMRCEKLDAGQVSRLHAIPLRLHNEGGLTSRPAPRPFRAQIVFAEGEPGTTFYVILSGCVSIRRRPDLGSTHAPASEFIRLFPEGWRHPEGAPLYLE